MTKARNSELVSGPVVKKWELASGSVHADGWATPQLEFRIWAAGAATIVVDGWNPEFCAKFWSNTITLGAGPNSARSAELALAALFSVKLEIKKPLEEPFLLTIASKSAIEPDALDQRLRGFILRAVRVEADHKQSASSA